MSLEFFCLLLWWALLTTGLCGNSLCTAGSLDFGARQGVPLATFPYSQTADGRVQRTLAICPGLDFDALVSAAVGAASTHRSIASLAGEARRLPATTRETTLSMIRSVSKRSSFKLGSLPIPLEEGMPPVVACCFHPPAALEKSDIYMPSARAGVASNHQHILDQTSMRVAVMYLVWRCALESVSWRGRASAADKAVAGCRWRDAA